MSMTSGARTHQHGVALGSLVRQRVHGVAVEEHVAVELVDKLLPAPARLLLQVVGEGARLHRGHAVELAPDLDHLGVLGLLVLPRTCTCCVHMMDEAGVASQWGDRAQTRLTTLPLTTRTTQPTNQPTTTQGRRFGTLEGAPLSSSPSVPMQRAGAAATVLRPTIEPATRRRASILFSSLLF